MSEYNFKSEAIKIAEIIQMVDEPFVNYMANVLEIAYTQGQLAQNEKSLAKLKGVSDEN